MARSFGKTEPKILTTVNLDILRAEDGEIACLLWLIDEEGQTDYLMSREEVSLSGHRHRAEEQPARRVVYVK